MKIAGLLLMIVGVIFGVALFGVFVDDVHDKVNLINEDVQEYQNFTLGEHNLSIIETEPEAYCYDISAYNATGGEEIIGNGNYTFYTNCSYIAQADSPYLNENVSLNYSYQLEPDEYIDDRFSRTMINVLTILFFLVILGGIISYILKAFDINKE